MNKSNTLIPSREEYIKLSKSKVDFDIKTEIVLLKDSIGRVTYKEIHSKNTLPNTQTSAMDGIAVKFDELSKENIDISKWKLGKEYIFSNTGVEVPEEYDTCIPIEVVEFDEKNKLSIKRFPGCKGERVNPRGNIMEEGDTLLPANYLITPYQIGVLASGGIEEIEVIAKPKVTIIPTGDELVSSGIPTPKGKNVETNTLVLGALVEEWGGDPIIYPIIPDDPEQLYEAVASAVEKSDIVIFNAGSSKGTHDYTIPVLERVGEVLAYQVAHGPGRPTSLAISNNKPILGLVGPPMGAELTARWYIRPLINKYLGQADIHPNKIKVRLLDSVSSPVPFDFYVQLKVSQIDGEYTAETLKEENKSNRVKIAVESNAILHIPNGKKFKVGDEVVVELKVPKEYI